MSRRSLITNSFPNKSSYYYIPVIKKPLNNQVENKNKAEKKCYKCLCKNVIKNVQNPRGMAMKIGEVRKFRIFAEWWEKRKKIFFSVNRERFFREEGQKKRFLHRKGKAISRFLEKMILATMRIRKMHPFGHEIEWIIKVNGEKGQIRNLLSHSKRKNYFHSVDPEKVRSNIFGDDLKRFKPSWVIKIAEP